MYVRLAKIDLVTIFIVIIDICEITHPLVTSNTFSAHLVRAALLAAGPQNGQGRGLSE